MKEKTKKEKQGLARLFELAGARKNKLTLACLLSVLSSAEEADQGKILALCAITFGAALVYGVCAYASSAISHTAAYEIIYELRLQLMEKLSRISSGYLYLYAELPYGYCRVPSYTDRRADHGDCRESRLYEYQQIFRGVQEGKGQDPAGISKS